MEEISESEGLLSQIKYKSYDAVKELTEKELRKFLKQLELKDTYQPRDSKGRFIKGARIYKPQDIVLVCNKETMKLFDEAIIKELDKWK